MAAIFQRDRIILTLSPSLSLQISFSAPMPAKAARTLPAIFKKGNKALENGFPTKIAGIIIHAKTKAITAIAAASTHACSPLGLSAPRFVTAAAGLLAFSLVFEMVYIEHIGRTSSIVHGDTLTHKIHGSCPDNGAGPTGPPAAGWVVVGKPGHSPAGFAALPPLSPDGRQQTVCGHSGSTAESKWHHPTRNSRP